MTITYICAHCGGIADGKIIPHNAEVIDNGLTLICDECGEKTVVLLLTPGRYKEHNTFFSKLYNLLQEAVERRAKEIAEIE